jgi:phosphohistidine phosphatase
MAAGQARTLILLRHAKSAWPDVPDHDRPLASRGRRDAPTAGRWLRSAAAVPDLVLCSSALRARQTWQLAEAALEQRQPVVFEDGIYGASAAELLDIVRHAPSAGRTIVVVGHNPGIQELAVALAGAAAEAGRSGSSLPPSALDRMTAKFPTAAIAVLEFSGPWSRLHPGQARLASFVTPRELASQDPHADT